MYVPIPANVEHSLFVMVFFCSYLYLSDLKRVKESSNIAKSSFTAFAQFSATTFSVCYNLLGLVACIHVETQYLYMYSYIFGFSSQLGQFAF